MPILLPLDQLRPGVSLTDPVFRGNQVLLTANRPLDVREIDALRRLVDAESIRVFDPMLDPVIDFDEDFEDRRLAGEARRLVIDALEPLVEGFTAGQQLDRVPFDRLLFKLSQVHQLLEGASPAIILPEPNLPPERFILEHSARVMILSMTIAQGLRHYVANERERQTTSRELKWRSLSDLEPLCHAAVLSHIGLFGAASLLKPGATANAETRPLLRSHPERSAALLPSSASPLLKAIIQAHHENMTGDGYPKGLEKDRLHVFARIIRIADAFEASLARKVFASARSPSRSLYELTFGPMAPKVDGVLVRILRQVFQPFVVGSRVRLSDGRIAVIAKYNRKDGLKPGVVPAFEKDGRRIPIEQIRQPFFMGERTGLFLGSLDGEDLAYLRDFEKPMPVSDLPALPADSVFEALYG